MLSGLGTKDSSGFVEIPPPNLISTLSSFVTRVVNLRFVVFNFSIYGTLIASADKSGSFATLFTVSSNTVSCARKGTSIHSFPSESIILMISCTLSNGIVNVAYSCAAPTENEYDLCSPLVTLTALFTK